MLNDFFDFADLFLSHYDSSLVRTKLKASFYGSHQSVNEASDVFLTAKLRLHRRVFDSENEEQIISDIAQLLHPSVQMVLLELPKTIDELFKKLEVIDRGRTEKNHTYKKDQYNHNAFKTQDTFRNKPTNNWTPHNSSKPWRTTNHNNPTNNNNNNWNPPKSTYPNNKEQTNQTSNTSTAEPNAYNQTNKQTHIGMGQISSSVQSPTINLDLNGKLTTAFLDTGANACFIRPELIPDDIPVQEDNIEITLAVNNTIQTFANVLLLSK